MLSRVNSPRVEGIALDKEFVCNDLRMCAQRKCKAVATSGEAWERAAHAVWKGALNRSVQERLSKAGRA